MKSTILPAVAALCFLASAAGAAIDPQACVVPPFISVVGMSTTLGGVDPTGGLAIYVGDDTGGDAIVGATVRLHFGDCTDLRLCSVFRPGQVLNCSGSDPWVEATTDGFGYASLTILGGGLNSGSAATCATMFPGPGLGCIRVEADAHDGNGFKLLPSSTAVIYDMNGAFPGGNGVTPLDLSIVKSDIGYGQGCNVYVGRADFSHDGQLTAADLAFLKTHVGNSGLGVGSGAGCASGGTPQPYCP